MKTTLTLILTAVLTCFAFAETPPVMKVAIYDSNKLQRSVGYQRLRELEYGKKYRDSIISLNQKLAELEDRLIAATKDEELKRVNLELSFVRSKLSAINSLAQTRANRGNDKIELTSLIKSNYASKYAVILQKGSSSNVFYSAIHANVQYVDITEDLAALINKTLSGKSPEK